MKKVIHIWLIEDDALDQEDVKRTLDRRGVLYRLTILRNGMEAVEALQQLRDNGWKDRPDIILLDLNMPKMNGFEVLDRLRDEVVYKDIRVFVLTTSEDQQDKMKAMQMGVSGFITKPLKLERPSSIDAFNLMMDLMNV